MLRKALLISLTAITFALLGGIVYFATVPQANEKFTEFYILGTKGKAGDYPQQVTLGNSVEVTIGVVNHEYQTAVYRVGITENGTKIKEIDIGSLTNRQEWEQGISCIPQAVGDKQLVEFWLYRDNGAKPYLEDPLRLYIDVKGE